MSHLTGLIPRIYVGLAARDDNLSKFEVGETEMTKKLA